MKLLTLLVLLLALVALPMTQSGCDSVTGIDPYTSEDGAQTIYTAQDSIAMVELATSALSLELDALTSGPVSDGRSSGLLEVMSSSMHLASARREALATHGISYRVDSTELTINEVRMTVVSATLNLTEHTVLSVATSVPGAPDKTEFAQDHLFTFSRAGSQWTITGHALLNGFRNESLAGQEKLVLPMNRSTIPEAGPGEDRDQLGAPGLQAAATLSPAGIVNYALTYALDRNTSYRSFNNDCCNFASQCLRAGGWWDVSGFYQRTDVWWYNWANQSYTWTSSHNWFWFTYNRPRGYIASRITDMKAGDIVQADWDRNGVIDHTMVVTRVDAARTPYLSYHTNNTKNKPFWDIKAMQPNANYYGWRLYSTIN